jgi:N-acetylglucosaminyldiphosphoundecaprenol N-acetyl-beta-D-mannosaminyltransferase
VVDFFNPDFNERYVSENRTPTSTNNSRINIFGVNIDNLDVDTLHSTIGEEVLKNNHSLILNVNVNCLNLAYENDWLREFLNQAKIVFCDGSGVILGGKILGFHIVERITYADWMWQFAEYVEKNDFSLYFLGAKPGVAERAARNLKNKFHKLRIVGVDHGYFDKEFNSNENQSTIEKINKINPNILIVAFGMPLQEKWLMENWSSIDSNIALTGGAVFDYLSGELTRSPKILIDLNLEWLGRLLIEPTRLWKRYLVGNPRFIYRILKQKFSGYPLH